MKDKIIYAITDYNGLFGSKHNSVPYKSGMDKEKLTKYFSDFNYKLVFVSPSEVSFCEDWHDRVVIYTSQEDPCFTYKDFLEDIVFGLEACGAKVVPSYMHLRANNNKLFMHILEDAKLKNEYKSLKNFKFSTLSELKSLKGVTYPVVVKLSSGAMSQNVSLARSAKELVRFVKNNSVHTSAWLKFKEFVRGAKYEDYKKQDLIKNKFVIQEFIPNLTGDYKVLKFGAYFYIFKRPVRENDFRASGSGQQSYFYGSSCEVPEGIFELVEKIANALNTPMLSIDVAVSYGELYIIEYQSIYFGTVGQHRSDVVYVKSGSSFSPVENDYELEKLYSLSIVEHINK